MAGDDEEKQLRSAAFQNAQSILLARRRAEETLERKTEQLALSLSMMRATLEATTDGILVTDEHGDITDFNSKFAQMWRLSLEAMEARNHDQLMALNAPQLVEPEKFLGTLREISGASAAESFHVLHCADGRILERHSNIQRVGDRDVGRVWSFRDITARQHAQDEVVQQREWFEVTLSSIGDAVITTDTNGCVTFLNPVAEGMTGWKTDDARGHRLEEVFHIINEASREAVRNPVRRVLAEGIVVGLANHTSLVSRDGRETAIEDSAAPIRDVSGKISGAVMVFHDVAARRKTENALRRSEKLLADFFENAAVGLHWVGADGIILRVNQTELNLLGYTEAEYVGHHVSEFHADADVIEEILERLGKGEGVENSAARLRCKDGSIKDVLISSNALVEEGKFIHSRCFTRDVTESKRASEAQARLAAVVESSDDAIMSKTLEGIIMTWNKGAERIFGYTEDEVIGRPDSLLIPADRVHEEEKILASLKRGERLDHYETVRKRKDGTLFDA
ncbi:MAG: luxQ 5, partial [Verrucomicrobia bacterium]|nr:luxQ 5 [Verrucomicrobiota bacterium]